MNRWGRLAGAVLVVSLGSALAAPGLLRGFGNFLVVSDPLAPADAVFVFPGNVPDRASCAAEIYGRGMASELVVSGERIQPELMAIGHPLTDAELNARLLQDAGVPSRSITVLNEGTSTWEDAVALRRWATSRPQTKRVIAVTSAAHSRRARITLTKVFRGTGIDLRMHPCPPEPPRDWWRHEETLMRVTNEYLKLGYYALNH